MRWHLAADLDRTENNLLINSVALRLQDNVNSINNSGIEIVYPLKESLTFCFFNAHDIHDLFIKIDRSAQGGGYRITPAVLLDYFGTFGIYRFKSAHIGSRLVAHGDGTGTITYTPAFTVVSHPALPPTTPAVFPNALIRCNDGTLSVDEVFDVTVSDTNQDQVLGPDFYSTDEDGREGDRPLLGRVVEKAADLGIITSSPAGSVEPLSTAHDILDGYDRPSRGPTAPVPPANDGSWIGR